MRITTKHNSITRIFHGRTGRGFPVVVRVLTVAGAAVMVVVVLVTGVVFGGVRGDVVMMS